MPRIGRLKVIKDSIAAKQVSDLMMDTFIRLSDSCHQVKERCSPEEYKAYVKAIAKLTGYINFNLMEPLYEEHPELKPPNWD
jgi:hypothetical protein